MIRLLPYIIIKEILSWPYDMKRMIMWPYALCYYKDETVVVLYYDNDDNVAPIYYDNVYNFVTICYDKDDNVVPTFYDKNDNVVVKCYKIIMLYSFNMIMMVVMTLYYKVIILWQY